MAKRKAGFSEKRINLASGNPLPVQLTEEEVFDVKTEFLWFFNGQNNARELLRLGNTKHLDSLYEKYKSEIGKMREHYGLDEIIREMDYAQGWFMDWKKMELFSREQFLDKVKASEDFSLVWADMGITDSLELRNWGITVQYDANDNASVAKQGKDQLSGIVNSIIANPENGLHCITLFNPSNTDERTTPLSLMTAQFVCDKMEYKERVQWLLSHYYETGMELEIMLESLKGENLDKLKWYDEYISVPQFKISLFANYAELKDKKESDQSCLFSLMFLKAVAAFLNMQSESVFIRTPKGVSDKSKTTKREISIEVNVDHSKGLCLSPSNIRIINHGERR